MSTARATDARPPGRRLPGRRGGAPVLDPDGRPAEGPVVVLRPRRVLVAAWACAVAIVAVFAVVAALLRNSNTGVSFRTADQVAMVLLGVLIAAGVLLLAWPRVRADARGIEVRNVGTTRYLPWELVRAVSFPDGASWARLDLPHYEYVSVLAVQAVDGQRAVAGMRQLRALHAAAHGAAPRPAPQAAPPVPPPVAEPVPRPAPPPVAEPAPPTVTQPAAPPSGAHPADRPDGAGNGRT